MSERIISDVILEYVMDHLAENPTMEDACAASGYGKDRVREAFREEYGMSFEKILKKYQLRELARILQGDRMTIKEAATRVSCKDRSNLSRSFKKEIGISPREIGGTLHRIPDMPVPGKINGHHVFHKYVRMGNFMAYGYPIKSENGSDTDLLAECAYAIEHPGEHFNLNESRKQLGFWWSEEKDALYYVHGYPMNTEHDIPEGARPFLFPAYDYVIFQVERGEDEKDILKTQRMLVSHVMRIWRRINHKVASTMVYTYEAFDMNYTYLYLPLIEGMPENKKEDKDMGMDSWLSYIDEHITENLSLKKIAAHFNYSESHFRRIFKMYYEISPVEYLQKRRLYRAAWEIKEHDGTQSLRIANRYHFRTLNVFRKLFREEFGVEPEDFRKVKIDAVNLDQYYERNKEKVRITFRNESDLSMIGTVIFDRNKEEESKELDIPQMVEYWLLHEREELKGTIYDWSASGTKDMISLWNSGDKSKGNEYILGPVAVEVGNLPEKYRKVTLPAGKYAVFESLQESDEDNLAETYRMLTRCSFYGWIHEYYFRVNVDKRTFVRFREKKLYFYVPVNE